MALRTPSSDGCEKIPVGLSFSGTKGYKAYEFLGKSRSFGYSKSGLVVELLNIYEKAVEHFGEDLAMFKLIEFVDDSDK